MVVSILWLFLIYMQMWYHFGTVPSSERYTDNTIQTSLVHGQQKLLCWLRISGPGSWRNTLLSIYALVQGSICSNSLIKCWINNRKRWKYWRSSVKKANTITKISITCTNRRNTETGGFERHQATYCISNW